MRTTGYSNTVADQALGQARGLPPKLAKTIPFDYVFEFKLTGQRGNRVQNVVEISIEGIFVATSIGYSLVLDEQRRPRSFPPVVDQVATPQNPVLIPFFTDNNEINGVLILGMPEVEVSLLQLVEVETTNILRAVTERATQLNGIVEAEFLDATTPLQVGKTDLITLGSEGTARVDFLASTLPDGSILRVWDRTNSLLSQLFIVGSPAATVPTAVIGPDPATKKLPTAGAGTVHIYGLPGDNVSVFLLENRSGNAIPVNGSPTLERDANKFNGRTGTVEMTLPQQLSPGDVLLVRSARGGGVDIDPISMYTIPRPKLSTLTLGALTAGLEKIGTDLTDGFRLNPNFANLAVADLPLDQISPEDRDKIFETGCTAAEEVSFLYSIDVVGTGRELQSRPIHNIAGLGIANGDRPFRPFAKPIVSTPRSSTRIQIEERSGPPGTLFIVLQGYKLLGTARIPE